MSNGPIVHAGHEASSKLIPGWPKSLQTFPIRTSVQVSFKCRYTVVPASTAPFAARSYTLYPPSDKADPQVPNRKW